MHVLLTWYGMPAFKPLSRVTASTRIHHAPSVRYVAREAQGVIVGGMLPIKVQQRAVATAHRRSSPATSGPRLNPRDPDALRSATVLTPPSMCTLAPLLLLQQPREQRSKQHSAELPWHHMQSSNRMHTGLNWAATPRESAFFSQQRSHRAQCSPTGSQRVYRTLHQPALGHHSFTLAPWPGNPIPPTQAGQILAPIPCTHASR